MKYIGAAIGGLAVGQLVKTSTQMAMSVESAMDNIRRNMGTSADAFNAFVETQSKSMAMAKKDAFTYGSTFSNLLGSFISDTRQTATQTQELMRAAAVIASKTGRTYEDVADRIRSGMLGSTEAIEDLGIYTQVSMIESTEAFKKFANGKSWNQLDFKIQQQIRLAAILEQTYARYGDTLADTTQTKQAKFIASLEDIKLNLGQAFLPIYNTVLPALTALAEKLENITAHFAAVSQTIFGKATKATVSSIEQQTQAIAEQGDAIETAGKQAKGSIAPFDEINKVTIGAGGEQPSGVSSASVVKSVVDTEAIATNDGFATSVENLKESIQPTIDALDRLKEALKPIGEFTYNSIKSFYHDVLRPIGEWTLGEGLPGLFDATSNLLNKIDWSTLTEAIKEFNKAIAPLAVEVGRGFIDFVTDISNIISPILAETISLLAAAISQIARALNEVDPNIAREAGYAIGALVTVFGGAKISSAIPDLLTKLGGGLTTLFAGLQNFAMFNPVGFVVAFNDLITSLDEVIWSILPDWIKNIYTGFWEVVTEIFTSTFNFDYSLGIVKSMIETFKNAFNGDKRWWEIGKDIVWGILQGFYAAFSFITEPIIDFFTSMWKNICDVFGISSNTASEMKPLGKNILQGIIDGFKGAFSNWWKSISEWGKQTKEKFSVWSSNIWGAVKKVFTHVPTWFKNKFNTAWNNIKKVFEPFDEYFSGLWEGIKTGFGNALGALKDIAKKPINGVIDVLNVLIDAMNKVSFDLPDWDILPNSIQGKKFGFNISKIPRLATGTVVPANHGEFLAILGDNKQEPEIVSPISYIKRAMMETLTEMSGASAGDINLNVYLSGKQIYSEVVKRDKEYRAQNGKSAFGFS